MITIEFLQSRFADRFSRFDQVEDDVARCVRSNEGSPFAVYYIDVSERIPGSVEELDEYQDRIVASRYFEGEKSLQWSQYLYFVVSSTVPLETRLLVERDRKYARKFVVDEQELATALTPPAFQVAEGVVDASVYNKWNEILAEANLDHAVFSNDALPQRIKRIEADFGHKALGRPSGVDIPQKEAPAFISTLDLVQYRPCPKQRSFDFGTVTLLTGQNGAGKTSLLEALELLYCGANKRDPKSKVPFKVKASFANGKVETATNKVPSTADLKRRNLAWYGQADLRMSTLYQSFSRYNFLDTDAAVAISSSESDFEKDLSKLLVGPEASKTWKEIERTFDGLQKRIREHLAVEQQVKNELAAVERQIKSAAAVPKESDSLRRTLAGVLTESGWKMPDEHIVANLSGLTSDFASFESIMEQAQQCSWTGSPVSIQTLRTFSETTPVLIADAGQAITTCHATAKLLQKNKTNEQTLSRRERSAQELSTYLESKYLEAESRLSELNRQLNELLAKLPHDQPDIADIKKSVDLGVSLGKLKDETRKLVEQSQKASQVSKAQLTAFTKKRDHALNLAQQLRDIADQILSRSDDKDTCPLCHTDFPEGELKTHVYRDIDSLLEEESAKHRESQRQADASLAEANRILAITEWLNAFATHCDLTFDIDIAAILRLVEQTKNQEASLRKEVTDAYNTCHRLRSQGMSIERFEEIVKTVFEGDTRLTPSVDSLKSLRKQIEEKRTALSRERKALEIAIEELKQKIAGMLGVADVSIEKNQETLARLKEQCETVVSILKRIDADEMLRVLREDTPATDLLTAVKVIRRLLSGLQIATTNEQQAVVLASESAKRKEEITLQLAGLSPTIKRCRDAEAVFQTILDEHSLASSMEEALQQNKAAIEEIFRRIHSPAEFAGLQDMTTLIRKDGQEAKLHQISTGQRAAYALSLFLAQNAQLRSAPQLILIDDPIAHVDDLNCLSFLDYLREIALSGDRQIVFATANEKIAALFQRKFDFLGEQGFRQHQMLR